MVNITFQNNKFLLSGELNFFNVMSVFEKSLPQLNHAPMLEFDFAQVKSSDSSALALIMEWIKFARLHDKAIRFLHLSAHLLSIAKAAGLDGFVVSAAEEEHQVA